MKILEVVFNLRPGGAERFAVDLTNELSKANEVTLMALKDDSVEPERDLFYASELAARVTYKNVGIGKGYSVHTVVKIHKAIKRRRRTSFTCTAIKCRIIVFWPSSCSIGK